MDATIKVDGMCERSKGVAVESMQRSCKLELTRVRNLLPRLFVIGGRSVVVRSKSGRGLRWIPLIAEEVMIFVYEECPRIQEWA